jgi:hypothetical protein
MSMHIACCGFTGEQKIMAASFKSKDDELKIEDIETIAPLKNKFLKPGEFPVILTRT